MQDILTDLSAPALVKAIRSNWADYYSYLGRSSSAELSVGPHLTWLLTGVPDSFLNVVFRTQLPADHAGEVIDEALAHFRSKNVTHLSWWIDTDTPRTPLEKQLILHGLTFNEGGTGMAADLKAVRVDAPIPAGLKIRPVEDKATLKKWIHIVSVGFGLPEDSEGRLFDLFADRAFKLPMRTYLALLKDEPVGTSQLFLSAGVAGIYNVTCLPEARGQGVGGSITLAPLLEARQMGYRVSILQASDLGKRVYRRLGFQDYGRLNNYLWANETQPDEDQ